jgi:NAD(P)-dependent dehydrogenase (short-subunit alcohol dehydrogenase family)
MSYLASEAGGPVTTALVTGAAGGIGEAIAVALADKGSRVVVADIDEAGALRVAGRIGGLAVRVDIADADSVAAAVAEIGPIDVLVNNAGVVGGAGPLATLPLEALVDVLRVNVTGTFLMTQAVAAVMIDAGNGGAIVNISSAGSFAPTAGLGHYEASKAAINALTRSAALELAPYGIRVNAIAPGPVETPLTSQAFADPAVRNAWLERIPLGRIATPADLVPIVLLLASPQGRHITGTVLPVDGGQLLKG